MGRLRFQAGDPAWTALFVLMLGYTALFLVYYPPLSGIEDEVGFVNQTLVWSRGAISAEGAGFDELGDFLLIKGRHVAQRHPGRSLLALPFVAEGGLRAIYLSGLTLHLAMTVLGAALLARLGRSPLWAVLLLFHPTLALYSRTMMADAGAGTGLLLSGLALTLGPGAGAGVWAGLGVGLAALMRYHAGAALPIVAAAFPFTPDRPHPTRDALLCLLTGGGIGGLIVAYNLALYGTLTDPFSANRGYFSWDLLGPHLLFYGSVLLVLWPGMLLAPVLDRSPIRWLVRGVCGFYLVFLSTYYFHDTGSGWIETVVVGQRLLEVALPLWVVSYAGMIDDWVARPVQRRLGQRAWKGLVVLCCGALLAGTGMLFHRHQAHLNRLHAARAAIAAAVPEGSLVVVNSVLIKLFAIPSEAPSYRCRLINGLGDAGELDRESRSWYLALLPTRPGGPLPESAQKLFIRYHLTRIPTSVPELALYVASEPAKGRS